MVKRIMFASLVLAVVAMGGAVWAQKYNIDDVMKEVQQLQMGQIRLEEGHKFLDWKLNLMLALMISILGFVFYLAKEIGFGTRDRIKELFARLQAVEEKLHLPHLPKSVLVFLLSFSILFTVSCLLVTPSCSAILQKINIQGGIK